MESLPKGPTGSTISLATAASIAIDSNELLTVCQRIRENMATMEKGIRVADLRLITLSYTRNSDVESSTLKCFDELIELCNLSRLLIRQLDELHQKLSESQDNPIDYQIASQQLMFFTSEWCDNLTPKLHEILELASKLNIDLRFSRTSGTSQLGPADTRVREALIRLRTSMGENERLIATIASNIDYTRVTLESIFQMLKSTKLGLSSGKQTALSALNVLKLQHRSRIICYIIVAIVIMLILAHLLYLIIKIFY